MRPVRITLGPLAAASANNIALSQTPLAGGNLTIAGAAASGGVATLDVARRVLFTFAADDSARTFTLYGTSRTGALQSETIAGVNATTTFSTLDYKTVTRIAVDAATAGALTVGTNGVASSAPIPCDVNGPPQISLQVDVTGTVNYTVQQTLNDIWGTGTINWQNHGDTAAMVANTASAQSEYAYVPTATRITLNSGTGSVVYTVVQPGAGYL